MFYKLENKCSVPPISLYEQNCVVPKFRTFVNVQFIELELSEIDNTNEEGQEVNDARAQGTDKNNVDGLKSSFLTKGVDTSIVPPIVIREKNNDDKHPLIEGFTRFAAHSSNEQNSIIVLAGDVAEGCNIEDIKDELGLGCNDHHSSKKATSADFETRLSKYINRTENVTRDMCYKWFDGIKHSFTDTKIKNIVTKVFDGKKASETMESMDGQSGKAQKIVKKLTGVDIKDIAVFNNNTGANFETMITKVIKYRSKFGKNPKIYGYLNNTVAQDAHKERTKMVNKVLKYNQTIRSIVQEANSVQLKDFEENDEIYEFLTLEGFIPQILGQETDIVPVDKI